MRKKFVTVLTWIGIILFAWTALLFIAFNAHSDEFNDQVMDIPTKCEYRRSKIRDMQKQFADRIFLLWIHQGNKIDPVKLYDQADYTASYILLDNGITCRRNK